MIGLENPKHEQYEVINIQHISTIGIEYPAHKQCENLAFSMWA
jgi:hypothetical protein